MSALKQKGVAQFVAPAADVPGDATGATEVLTPLIGNLHVTEPAGRCSFLKPFRIPT
jgi:hypothetical protein